LAKKIPGKFFRKLTDKINNVAYLISHRTALLIVLTLIGLIHIRDVPMNSIYDHISNTPDLSDSLSHSQTAGRDPIDPDLENSYESQENPGQKISREISQRNPSETREI